MKIRPTTVLLTTLAAFLVGSVASEASDTLRLRPNDAIAEPGGRVAVVLRTYAPRAVGVGQICVRMGTPAGGDAVTGLESYQVFSEAFDVISSVELRPIADGHELFIEFASPSGTINESDGPLAAIFLTLDNSIPVGTRIPIRVDVGGTRLFDPDGNPIAIEGRDGEILVRAPNDPLLVAADGDTIEAGEIAELAVETHEPFAISEGRLVLKYKKSWATDVPGVLLDRRHGRRQFTIDVSKPGRVIVDFTSPDDSYNEVPGEIVRLFLPTTADLPAGARSRFKVRRNKSWLLGPDGENLPVRFKKGAIEIE